MSGGLGGAVLRRRSRPAAVAVQRPDGLLRRALSRTRTRVGFLLTGAVAALALLGPVFAPHATSARVGEPFQSPTMQAVLGTDNLGRDVLSRFLAGGGSLLALAVACTVTGVVVGGLAALLAGRRDTWLDELLGRGGDVVLALPPVAFALLLASVWGPRPWIVVVAVGIALAPRIARAVRSALAEVVAHGYVEADEALGLRRWRVYPARVLPNVTGAFVAEAWRRFAYSVGLVAGLGVIGFGVQPPGVAWGLMIHENRVGLLVQPWAVLMPAAAVGVLAVGAALVGDGFASASTDEVGEIG